MNRFEVRLTRQAEEQLRGTGFLFAIGNIGKTDWDFMMSMIFWELLYLLSWRIKM